MSNMDAINEAAKKYANEQEKITRVMGSKAIAEKCKDNFKAGAQWYAEQFKAEEKQSAGIWVKASERLPKKEGWYFLKTFIGEDMWPATDFFNGYNFGTDSINTENGIQWLDETPQKQTIITDLPAPPWDDSVTHNLELKEVGGLPMLDEPIITEEEFQDYIKNKD